MTDDDIRMFFSGVIVGAAIALIVFVAYSVGVATGEKRNDKTAEVAK